MNDETVQQECIARSLPVLMDSQFDAVNLRTSDKSVI
jgi:hypothetical protein